MDQAADFDRIVAEHEGQIVRHLTRFLGDRAQAQDLTQETLLRVHRHLPELEAPEALTAWIYRIASNLALDHVRSQAHRQARHTVPLADDVPDDTVESPGAGDAMSAESRLEQEEMAACVREHVHRLPPRLRASLVLRDLEGLGEASAADILGCSVGAVKIRTHRARTALRERLRQDCEFYQDGRGVLLCEPSPGSTGGQTP